MVIFWWFHKMAQHKMQTICTDTPALMAQLEKLAHRHGLKVEHKSIDGTQRLCVEVWHEDAAQLMLHAKARAALVSPHHTERRTDGAS
jgi:hypothetical protein